MRLAYVGAFEHSWSTESHVARDAESLGLTVDRITTTDLAEIEAQAEGADLLICHRTGLPGALTDVWRRLEAHGTRTTSYHLDLYAGLARWVQVATDPFWRTGTVFTADGDPTTTQALADLGINHRWLPAAVVSDETEPGVWRDEYDYDVVFVGAERYPHPEWPWRAELIAGLKQRYGSRFKVFGHHPPTRDGDLNDLYATARVVVGDTLCLPGHRNYTSDRIFETLGRGGTLVYPRIEGLDILGFHEREHYLGYDIGDLNSVAQAIDWFLDDRDAAAAMAIVGRQLVRERHTYRHRIVEMLQTFDSRTSERIGGNESYTTGDIDRVRSQLANA